MLFFSGVNYRIDKVTNCWITVSHKPTKSGYIYINRVYKKGYLHRLLFSDRIKPVVTGERIKHSCKNKTCINPEHLYSTIFNADN